MPRFACYSLGIERHFEAKDYEAPSAAKAAASHAAHVYKTKADHLGSQKVIVSTSDGTRAEFSVEIVHSIEFKATQVG